MSTRRAGWLAAAALMALLGIVAMLGIGAAAADHDVVRLAISAALVPASWWLTRGALGRAAA